MFTLKDILQGNAGKIEFSPSSVDNDLTFLAASHDSRKIHAGDLFVALAGEHMDGHTFIPESIQAGARAVLCKEFTPDLPEDFLQIRVPDVLKALQATARVRAQRQTNTIFIGITGSNGKTSTKDALATMLSTQAPTHKTQASYNHEIGYPLTLLRLEPQHRYAILEMGAQYVGELAGLCQEIFAPTWSIITNVGTSHLEYFGSQERIALAKSELVQALPQNGYAILNYDDPYVRAMAEKTRAQVIFYGTAPEATVRASEITGDALFGLRFLLSYQGESVAIQLRLPGTHGVSIALATAAAALMAGIQLKQIAQTLESLQPTPGRGQIEKGPHGAYLINDSYNATRQSILAISTSIKRSTMIKGKRWAVLGDIFELGEFAPSEHYQTGLALADAFDYLVAIGEQAREYVKGAQAGGMHEGHVFYYPADVNNLQSLKQAKQEAAQFMLQRVRSEDLILLKGSRGMEMESMLTLWEELAA